MTKKTISGHYDTVYSLSHNNRDFVPNNVDATRIKNNQMLVMAGHPVVEEYCKLKDIPTLWQDYRTVSNLYWRDQSIHREELDRLYKRLMRQQQDQRRIWRKLSNNPIACFKKLSGFISSS